MKPKSFHAAVVDRLAAMIIGGERGMGSQLPTEGELCLSMGVSRTVLREAVKTLVAKGMLTTGPRIGTRTLPPPEWNLLDPDVIRWRLAAGVDQTFVRDILELRLAIEPEAAKLAALRADAADLAALEAAHRAMVTAVETGSGGYLAADLAFHETILAATHNQFFAALMPAVDALLRVSFRFSVKSRASARSSLPLHAAVASAIAAREPEAAEAAIRALIAAARQDIETDIAADDFLFIDGEPQRGDRHAAA
jgi:DNA-binding FadR family transcriptional regulator